MNKVFARLFGLRKKDKPKLHGYAVQMRLMLDENTQLGEFVGIVAAKSKRDAKWQVKNRAYVKVGAVANKAEVERYQNRQK